jgi:hypothetical protein
MAGTCPTMYGLRQYRHNSALQLLLSLMEHHNGGRWDNNHHRLWQQTHQIICIPLVALVGERPLEAVVSSVARPSIRKPCTRAVVLAKQMDEEGG